MACFNGEVVSFPAHSFVKITFSQFHTSSDLMSFFSFYISFIKFIFFNRFLQHSVIVKIILDNKKVYSFLTISITMDAQAMKYLAVGLLGIAFAGAAMGVGKIVSSALEGIARNPQSEGSVSKYMFIGAGLAEAMGLFGLVLALLLMFA